MTQALILFHLETPSLVEIEVSKRPTYRSNLGESPGKPEDYLIYLAVSGACVDMYCRSLDCLEGDVS